jgi:hypothetical protein
MRIWGCPLGCPVAARTSDGLASSEVLLDTASAPTLRPQGGRNEWAGELAAVGPDPGATD